LLKVGLNTSVQPISITKTPTFHILIFSSETTGEIATKLWWNGPWITPFQIVTGDHDFQPRWPPS
jgi:hypothetical protein